jgi:hypothetical protein
MKTEYLKIYTSSLIIINSIRNLKHENNIISLVKNHPESARLAGFGSSMDSVELYIFTKDLEKSQPILNAFKKEINS